MAIYTVGRRRVIIALLLTSALILTLDLRGNAVLDRSRDAFGVAMAPVENAADVVTNPVQRLWNAYSNYDDLQQENDVLRQQVNEMIGTQAASEAAVVDLNQILALSDLPSLAGVPTEKARVVGASSNNLDQIVEINKGSLDDIEIGMPVVNRSGLVGRITSVGLNTAKVRLVSDPKFVMSVEVLGGTGADDDVVTEPPNTTPSGRTGEENDEIIEDDLTPPTSAVETTPADGTAVDTADADPGTDPSAPGDTTVLDVFGDDFPLPEAGDAEENAATGDTTGDTSNTSNPGDKSNPGDTSNPDDPSDTTVDSSTVPEEGSDDDTATPVDGSTVPSSTTTTTTTEPEQLEKEFGAIEGRGQGRLPQIRFLQDNPSLSILQVGDIVQTAGGSDSLAPPNIPVGRVINRVNRPGVAGPVLEIELNADLDTLGFVQVVQFRPASEVEQ